MGKHFTLAVLPQSKYLWEFASTVWQDLLPLWTCHCAGDFGGIRRVCFIFRADWALVLCKSLALTWWASSWPGMPVNLEKMRNTQWSQELMIRSTHSWHLGFWDSAAPDPSGCNQLLQDRVQGGPGWWNLAWFYERHLTGLKWTGSNFSSFMFPLPTSWYGH